MQRPDFSASVRPKEFARFKSRPSKKRFRQAKNWVNAVTCTMYWSVLQEHWPICHYWTEKKKSYRKIFRKRYRKLFIFGSLVNRIENQFLPISQKPYSMREKHRIFLIILQIWLTWLSMILNMTYKYEYDTENLKTTKRTLSFSTLSQWPLCCWITLWSRGWAWAQMARIVSSEMLFQATRRACFRAGTSSLLIPLDSVVDKLVVDLGSAEQQWLRLQWPAISTLFIIKFSYGDNSTDPCPSGGSLAPTSCQPWSTFLSGLKGL